MRDPSGLNDRENWAGGFYELAVEIGPHDDARLEQTLMAMWRLADVQGSFAATGLTPMSHAPVSASLASLEEAGHLCGIVRLPDGQDTVCGAVAVREEGGSDWLVFYLPLGALAKSDTRIGAYPDDEDTRESQSWRRPLDDWLVELGTSVYRELPFRLALIGFEACGEANADQLSDGVPDNRFCGYLVPTNGLLRWHQSNR